MGDHREKNATRLLSQGKFGLQLHLRFPISYSGDGGSPHNRPPLLLWLPHIVLVVLKILRTWRIQGMNSGMSRGYTLSRLYATDILFQIDRIMFVPWPVKAWMISRWTHLCLDGVIAGLLLRGEALVLFLWIVIWTQVGRLKAWSVEGASYIFQWPF